MPAHGSGGEPIGDRRGKPLTPKEQEGLDKAREATSDLREDPPPAEPTPKTD